MSTNNDASDDPHQTDSVQTNDIDTNINNQELDRFRLGDRVKLSTGKTGVVRYIGNAHFTSEEVVGLELDSWDPNGCDGTINNIQIFEASPGRGYFFTKNSTDNKTIVKSQIVEGSYARLKGLTLVPRFNGKTVKVVSFVEKKSRWKVKLLQTKQEKKYLGVFEQNLDPILDWDINFDNDINYDNESLNIMPSIGDGIKTKNGLIGIVKFVGKTQFGPIDEIYIGLELKEWYVNAHDGQVKDVKYFTAKPGTGYFAKLNFLQSMFLPWNIERVIWIAYKKNIDNHQCLIPTLSKDIVWFLLSYLRSQ